MKQEEIMEERTAKILFNKSGGTAGKGGVTNRITLPTLWIKKMGITENNREVKLSFVDDKIIIEKGK